MGSIYRAEGKLAESYEGLTKATQLAPNDPTVTAHLGIVHAECGDRKKAMELLKKALGESKNFLGADEAETILTTLRKDKAVGAGSRASHRVQRVS